MDISVQRVTSYIRYRRNQRFTLLDEYRKPLCDLLSLLRPQQAKGFRKIRIGEGRDGSYVMLDDLREIGLALSLGIGPDVSWDYALAKKGIRVWQYDHTVSASPLSHPLFHFEPRRIVDRVTSPHDLSMTELLQKATEENYLLKIDIESDEWNIFADLDPQLLRKCRQITMELHDFISIQNPDWCHGARKTLSILSQDFGVVHVHGNNLSKHIHVGHLILPDNLEVTFANRRFYDLIPTNEMFPGSLDKKNNLFFPDIHLGRFQFSRDA